MKQVDRAGVLELSEIAALLFVAVASLVAVGCSRVSQVPAGPSQDRPNILFILVDDLGQGDLGAYGADDLETPAIDALAAQGMRFTHFYTNAVCSPTRAAILTGRYPQTFGIRRALAHFKTSRGIPASTPFIAEILQKNGYRTTHVGKWHVGLGKSEYWGINRGFGSTVTYAHPDKSKRYLDPEIIHDFRFTDGEVRSGHQTELLTDSAIAFLTEQSRSSSSASSHQPFFLNLWYQAVHGPNEPPSHWSARYPDLPRAQALFAGAVSHVDEQVGRLLNALEELDLSAGTLVVLASDNGSARGRHESNSGLRGFKGTLYEGGIRSPMIIRWPERVEANSVANSILSDLDLFPTFAEVAGADVTHLQLDGESFLDVLLHQKDMSRETPLFWEQKFSNRQFQSASGLLNSFAVRVGDWKVLFEENDSRLLPSLFDLADDPGETVDRAEEQPEIVGDLLARYWTWRRRVGLVPWQIAEPFPKAGSPRPGGPPDVSEAIRFDEPGALRVKRDSRFDFNDGDFSLVADIQWSPAVSPDASAPVTSPHADAVLATKPGSWSLVVDGHGRLELEVIDQEGEVSTLLSRSKLEPGAWHQIAFTVYGFRLDNSIVSLYLDQELEAENRSVAAVRSNDHEIVLGNDERLESPFLGSIRHLRFWVSCLAQHELRAMVADGPIAGDISGS